MCKWFLYDLNLPGYITVRRATLAWRLAWKPGSYVLLCFVVCLLIYLCSKWPILEFFFFSFSFNNAHVVKPKWMALFLFFLGGVCCSFVFSLHFKIGDWKIPEQVNILGVTLFYCWVYKYIFKILLLARISTNHNSNIAMQRFLVGLIAI